MLPASHGRCIEPEPVNRIQSTGTTIYWQRELIGRRSDLPELSKGDKREGNNGSEDCACKTASYSHRIEVALRVRAGFVFGRGQTAINIPTAKAKTK